MSSSTKKFLDIIGFPLYLIIFLWLIHLLKLTFNLDLSQYGLMPRDTSRAIGILTSPFIHGNLQHIISNSVALFVLTAMIIIFYKRVAYQSIILIYFLTGLAVWLFARGNVIHIGASGVVYGLVSFVFWTGLFRRNIKSIILALIVTILYSGYFMGLLPLQKGISWESHLFGALVGIIVAFWFKNDQEHDENVKSSWEDDAEEPKYFLKRDIFEKTRDQRELEERIKRERGDIWTTDIG